MRLLKLFVICFIFFSACKEEPKPCNSLSSDSGLAICDVCPEGTIYVDYKRCLTLRKGEYWGYKKDSGLPSDTIVLRYLSLDSFPANPGKDFNMHFSVYDTKFFMSDWNKGGRYYLQQQDSFYMQRDARRILYFDNVAESTISGRFLNNGKQMKLVFHFMDYFDYTPIGDSEFLLNRVE
jgi:hypothetical protein